MRTVRWYELESVCCNIGVFLVDDSTVVMKFQLQNIHKKWIHDEIGLIDVDIINIQSTIQLMVLLDIVNGYYYWIVLRRAA